MIPMSKQIVSQNLNDNSTKYHYVLSFQFEKDFQISHLFQVRMEGLSILNLKTKNDEAQRR